MIWIDLAFEPLYMSLNLGKNDFFFSCLGCSIGFNLIFFYWAMIWAVDWAQIRRGEFEQA